MHPNKQQGSAAPKRKLVLVPFKTKPKLPENFEAMTWTKLESAIHAVNTKVSCSISKEELYRAVEDLCMHKMAAETYEKLSAECDRHISSRVEALENPSLHYVSFLEAVDTMWQDHCEHMITIRNIFLYLDRSYALQTPKVLSIWDLGLRILRDNFESRKELLDKLIVGLLSMIEHERQDQMVDQDMMRRLLRMLYSIGLYTDRFQFPFIRSTEHFFINEGRNLIEKTDAAFFMAHIEKRLIQANDMVVRYLDVSSRVPLLEAIERELLAPHINTLLERGLENLLQTHKLIDLKRMYYLFDRVKCLSNLCKGWCDYLKKVGTALVSDENRDKTMVEEVLEFYDKADEVLRAAFLNEESFKNAKKESFENFINTRSNKSAELLARFVDRKMRGEKGQSDGDIEIVLDRIMCIFSYLSSKDVFEAFYKRMLSKRLLLERSASDDLERVMLSKLKAECGPNYTSKLEGMLQDIELSREILSQFRKYCNDNSNSSSSALTLPSGNHITCEFKVLTQGFWPGTIEVNLAVPPQLTQWQSLFSVFYTSKYQGRRLNWAHELDRCVVTARLPKGKKELELSFYQTLVVLCFNVNMENTDDVVIDLNELRQKTGIEDGELRRTLQSLACGKLDTRILTKSPKGREVEDTDTFSINLGFTNKLFRIKVNAIQVRETVEETQRTHEEVFRDRQYQVDAVIVRTMKARKVLAHNALMPEVMSQLRFPARIQDIKKRIENLIERDYLERDINDQSIYRYLA
jgi:cullin 4